MPRNSAALKYNASNICIDNEEMHWPPVCFIPELHFPSGSEAKLNKQSDIYWGPPQTSTTIFGVAEKNASDTTGFEINDLRNFYNMMPDT